MHIRNKKAESWINVNPKIHAINALIGPWINTLVAGYNFGMVKRKAEISLDEWLRQGTLYAEVSRVGAATAVVQGVAESSHGHEGAPLKEGTVASLNTLAEPVEQGAAEWFWELLSQCGYELW